MNMHRHDITNKLIVKRSPSFQHILEKIALLFIPFPLLMVYAGTLGIIENDTPDSLASIASMGSSFLNFFEMHTLIIAGSFGVTFIIWLVTKNLWSQTDELYFGENNVEEIYDKNQIISKK